MKDSRPRAWFVDLSLVAVAFIWGTTFVLVKQALAEVSTLLFLALRFTAATAVLALIFRREFKSPKRRESIRAGVIAGTLLFAGYVLQTFGLRYTSASKTGFITGLYIPLVPLLSALVYKKAPKLSELVGVAAAFAGMALMSIQGDVFDISRGDLLVVGCAVAFAFHILALGHFAGTANVGILSVVQIATAMCLGSASFWWIEPIHLRWTSQVIIALAVTSLLATAFAFSVQTWAQRWSSPTRTAVIFSLEPVFAWATSYVVAGETLTPRATAGAVLILAGIFIVELKPFGRKPAS